MVVKSKVRILSKTQPISDFIIIHLVRYIPTYIEMNRSVEWITKVENKYCNIIQGEKHSIAVCA